MSHFRLDRFYDLIDRHAGAINKHCVIRLLQRRDRTCHISVITLFDVTFDHIDIAFFALLDELLISALRTRSGAGGQIDLALRVRKHTGTDVSAVHDNVFLLGDLLLDGQKLLADYRINADGGCHVSDCFLTQKCGNVLPV